MDDECVAYTKDMEAPIILSPEESLKFVEALKRPPEPNEKLVELFNTSH